MIPLGSARQNRWEVSADRVDLVRPGRLARPVHVAAMPKPLTLDLARCTAVVIDMQNDFCTPGGWLHHIGVDVSPTRRAVAGLAPLLPVLRGAGVPVIWLNWGNRSDRLNLSPALLHVYNPSGAGIGLGDALNGAAVLEKDSWGAAIVDALPQGPGDIHVDKFRMSGFWDTPLDSILRNLRVDTVLFGGVNADQCVMATLQDANFPGYDTILLEDGSATTSPGFCWEATLYNVRQCFGFSLHGSDLAASIDALNIGATPMNAPMNAAIAKPAKAYEAWRISPGDSNRLALIFDPVADGANFIAAVEIFDEGGRTPPNLHQVGQEMFFVLKGEGRATCDGRVIDIRTGDSLLLKPGINHAIENTGPGRLYCLTVMVPDDRFAALIRSGVRAELDDEDLGVLGRVMS